MIHNVDEGPYTVSRRRWIWDIGPDEIGKHMLLYHQSNINEKRPSQQLTRGIR